MLTKSESWHNVSTYPPPLHSNASRGGGGTQIWFRRGCAAEAAKPIPIFKGHFGGKDTHY